MAPVYEFQNLDNEGDIMEKVYPMGQAPEIGELVYDRGAWYKRIVSQSHISADVKNVVHGYPYTSRALPKNLEGCSVNKRGQPIIKSRQHEKEVCARHGYIRE